MYTIEQIGIITGIVVGAIVLLAIIGTGLYFLIRWILENYDYWGDEIYERRQERRMNRSRNKQIKYFNKMFKQYTLIERLSLLNKKINELITTAKKWYGSKKWCSDSNYVKYAIEKLEIYLDEIEKGDDIDYLSIQFNVMEINIKFMEIFKENK